MRNHLSIFSSNSNSLIRFRLVVSGVFMLCSFLLLAILNFVVSRVTLPYLPNSLLGEEVRYLWYESEKEKNIPSVMFLGSSRLHSCVLTNVFEDYASERGINVRFINASQPSLGYWEFSRILSFVDLDKLHAKVCVVEVNPWTFNRQIRHPITKEIILFRREYDSWGTLGEICEVDKVSVRLKLLMRAIIPKRTLKDWLTVIRGIRSGGPSIHSLPAPGYHLVSEYEEQLRNDPDFFAENISQCHMLDYKFSNVKRDAFVKFIQNLERAGIEVVLIHAPVRENYFEYVKGTNERLKEYQKHLAFLSELSQHYRTLFWQVPADADLDDTVFVDYGHFSYNGAKIFSKLVAERMKDIIEQLN